MFFAMNVLVCTVLTAVSVAVAASDFIVESPAGKFQGQELIGSNKQTYVAFQGIPYAKPPVGELRFAKPEPHPRFDDVFDATKPMAICPQPEIGRLKGPWLEEEFESEDCLQLNVYCRDLNPRQEKKKKVLVFIHGGAFIIGTARNFPFGTFVTEQDVIVVSINYRLGILGFLATENEASPGNFGMWDQILALQWVKDNIASFGGDPDDVTISGESAGSAAVSLLSISPAANGLFTKVFPMSGAATAVFANFWNPNLSTLNLAKSTNCWEGDTEKKVGLADSETIVKCLRERPVSELMKIPIFDLGRLSFVPTVDGEFLPKSPLELMKDDHYLKSVGYFDRHYLLGYDNNDLACFHMFFTLTAQGIMGVEDRTEEERNAMVSNYFAGVRKGHLRFRLGTDEPSAFVSEKIVDWYERRFGNESVIHIVNDLSFIIPAFEFLDPLAKQKSQSGYLFYFNYYPGYMKGAYKGMVHGMDLLYWTDFSVENLAKLAPVGMEGDFDHKDAELKSLFSSVLAEFMRSGNPLSSELRTKLPSGWPAYDLDNRAYLDFSDHPLVSYHLERERWKLWSELVPKWIEESESSTGHTEL